jgi:hypothetical protein
MTYSSCCCTAVFFFPSDWSTVQHDNGSINTQSHVLNTCLDCLCNSDQVLIQFILSCLYIVLCSLFVLFICALRFSLMYQHSLFSWSNLLISSFWIFFLIIHVLWTDVWVARLYLLIGGTLLWFSSFVLSACEITPNTTMSMLIDLSLSQSWWQKD